MALENQAGVRKPISEWRGNLAEIRAFWPGTRCRNADSVGRGTANTMFYMQPGELHPNAYFE